MATGQVGGCGRSVNEVTDELGCVWHTINDAVIAYGKNALADDITGTVWWRGHGLLTGADLVHHARSAPSHCSSSGSHGGSSRFEYSRMRGTKKVGNDIRRRVPSSAFVGVRARLLCSFNMFVYLVRSRLSETMTGVHRPPSNVDVDVDVNVNVNVNDDDDGAGCAVAPAVDR